MYICGNKTGELSVVDDDGEMMMKMMMIVSPTVSQAKPYSPLRPSTEKAISALLKVTSSYFLPPLF